MRVNKRTNFIVVFKFMVCFFGWNKGWRAFNKWWSGAMNNASVPALQLMHLYPLTGFLGMLRHIEFAAINATSFSSFFPSIQSSFLNIPILFM